jgi:hypothetical protein
LYAAYYINDVAQKDAHAIAKGSKLPDAQPWMRSTGLSAADWGVITEYMECLKPLKNATERLEGRGKSGRFGAIYEIIPVFKYLLTSLESLSLLYNHVDYSSKPDAPKDHIVINLKVA